MDSLRVPLPDGGDPLEVIQPRAPCCATATSSAGSPRAWWVVMRRRSSPITGTTPSTRRRRSSVITAGDQHRGERGDTGGPLPHGVRPRGLWEQALRRWTRELPPFPGELECGCIAGQGLVGLPLLPHAGQRPVEVQHLGERRPVLLAPSARSTLRGPQKAPPIVANATPADTSSSNVYQ